MQGNKTFMFMLLRGMHPHSKHKKSMHPRWMVERGIPLPTDRLYLMGSYTNPKQNVNPVWDGVRVPEKPVKALVGLPVGIQSHSTGGAGWYFTADGVLYGPCIEWPEILAKVNEVVATGAKDLSNIEWRDK